MVKFLTLEELEGILKKAKAVMSFCPKDDEPNIWFLNQWILEQKGFLICPKVEDEQILPCKICSLDELKKGRW